LENFDVSVSVAADSLDKSMITVCTKVVFNVIKLNLDEFTLFICDLLKEFHVLLLVMDWISLHSRILIRRDELLAPLFL